MRASQHLFLRDGPTTATEAGRWIARHGVWAFRSRTKAEVSSLIGLWRRFVAEVRSSATLREELKAEGLGSTMERWQSRNQLGTK